MLDYFEYDLLTSIDEKYRTNGFKIYSGFMENGALGLFSLFNRPKLFNNYIISSPSQADNFGLLMSEAKKKLNSNDEQIQFLYLATGNNRYEQGNLLSFELVEKALQVSAPKLLIGKFIVTIRIIICHNQLFTL